MSEETPDSKPPAPPIRCVVVDASGHPQGFYSSDIHATPPHGAVRITEAQYQLWHDGLSANPTRRYQLIKGTLLPYNPPAVVKTLSQQAAEAVHAGLKISLCGSINIASTLFPTDVRTLQKIGAVVASINATGGFPGGVSTYPMKDLGGTWQHFTVDQYKAVAGAITAYVSECDLIADGNPLGASYVPQSFINLTV